MMERMATSRAGPATVSASKRVELRSELTNPPSMLCLLSSKKTKAFLASGDQQGRNGNDGVESSKLSDSSPN